jgi:hypothetical protein
LSGYSEDEDCHRDSEIIGDDWDEFEELDEIRRLDSNQPSEDIVE